MHFDSALESATSLDRADPLAELRARFHIPSGRSGEKLYLVGHSLGLQPKSVRPAISEELDAWARDGVDAHFVGDRPWTRYDDVIAPGVSRIVGAQPQEVVMMNALTVNLHLMMISFYRPTPTRYKVMVEEHAFPSDRFAVASQVRLHGLNPRDTVIVAQPRPGEHTLRTEDICDLIGRFGHEIALVMLGGVNYYTGQAFELAPITAAAHEAGCSVGFDLAHAAANVELHLHDWNVDFAVWCSYKYLNCGPGSLAGCFVHERHANRLDLPRLAGWWGESVTKRFEMTDPFVPMGGAGGWQISNPNILSLAAIRASLAIFDEAGLDKLRTKQRLLTGYLEYLVKTKLYDVAEIITPEDPNQRGSQLSLLIRRNGRALYERLRDLDVVCDWRDPDVIRVAPVPLYNRFEEVWRFVDLVERLAEVKTNAANRPDTESPS